MVKRCFIVFIEDTLVTILSFLFLLLSILNIVAVSLSIVEELICLLHRARRSLLLKLEQLPLLLCRESLILACGHAFTDKYLDIVEIAYCDLLVMLRGASFKNAFQLLLLGSCCL